MNGCCERLRAVDISAALRGLESTEFRDTGGTNGHIAFPSWLLPFVESLDIPGSITYAVVRKLPPYQGIPPHIDHGVPEINSGRRFHVPLLTHADVTMRWPHDGIEVHLEAGYLYEVDYTRTHEIVHKAPVDRIHIQINAQAA